MPKTPFFISWIFGGHVIASTTFILGAVTCVLSLAIFFMMGHSDLEKDGLPFLSDTGRRYPEAVVFRSGIGILSFLGFLLICSLRAYIQGRLDEAKKHDEKQKKEEVTLQVGEGCADDVEDGGDKQPTREMKIEEEENLENTIHKDEQEGVEEGVEDLETGTKEVQLEVETSKPGSHRADALYWKMWAFVVPHSPKSEYTDGNEIARRADDLSRKSFFCGCIASVGLYFTAMISLSDERFSHTIAAGTFFVMMFAALVYFHYAQKHLDEIETESVAHNRYTIRHILCVLYLAAASVYMLIAPVVQVLVLDCLDEDHCPEVRSGRAFGQYICVACLLVACGSLRRELSCTSVGTVRIFQKQNE
eukprot:TRINITY_DN11632_c0_g1_i2.p1 TRINITY_DN11632_c0_g1~~TRINITY_DN11632_c0_g1_i2.p1  ORF type:complete len:383 (+),score=96.54 TRINITY_DN11632_c0_g1_i2:65-1150(+)